MDREHIDKLTSALYRVTERMENDEPLKWRLRKCALRLGELIREDDDHELSFKEESERKKLAGEIVRMLQLAASLSYVSRVNFDILLREYLPLETTKREDHVEELPSAQAHMISEKTVSIRESEKESVLQKDIVEKSESISRNSTESHKIKKERSPEREKESVVERQRKILNFLDSTQSSSIGEVVVLFGDSVSEKTVQRDLNDLMTRGLVGAEGEKRWRRYFAVRE